MASYVKQVHVARDPRSGRIKHTMNQHIETLSNAELLGTVSGDWNWGDFFSGATWGLGAGCTISGHPVLCFGAFISGGFSLYF